MAVGEVVQRGKVVGARFDSALANVEALGGDVVVQIGADKLEFGVVEVTVFVGEGAKS